MFENRKDKRQAVIYIPITRIEQSFYSSRSMFDGEELKKLADSIRKNGLLVPISVQKTDNGNYRILSGERRLRASLLNGVKNIKCICCDNVKTPELYSVIENIERRDLHFFELAEALQKIIKNGTLSQSDVAGMLNLSQGALSNKLRLLKLESRQRKIIIENGLTERHARALLQLPENLRQEVLDVTVSKKLTVAETEKLIESLKKPKLTPKRKTLSGDLKLFQNSITRLVHTLCRSGVNAVQSKNETAEYIEYTVRIPKPSQQIIPFNAFSKET